ncbi:glycine betaine ABC transporter substrate-binding protein [Curtobacterium sp. MCPF17_052]|uniref:glycine betaine ABC transporter substrate-binding protein n=1 Tax=Curtobacterium sp. MCPF17_052 TaxID=2175655 RepID=UPI0034638EF7
MNNTYAFAVRKEAVKDLDGITKLSQIADLPADQRTFCVESEFNSRADGFKPMLAKYGMTLGGSGDGAIPKGNVDILDTGTVYTATDRGTCNFGEVFTTDGRIKSLGLQVLEDDQGFFPAYNVAPVLSSSALEQYPQLEGGLRPDLAEAHRRGAAGTQPAGRRRGARARGRGVRVDGEGGLHHEALGRDATTNGREARCQRAPRLPSVTSRPSRAVRHGLPVTLSPCQSHDGVRAAKLHCVKPTGVESWRRSSGTAA